MRTEAEVRRRKIIYFALFVYWIILLLATSLPTPSLPDIRGGDKIQHFTAYLVLALLLTATLHFQEKSPILKKYAALSAVFIAAFYGFVDEIHQSFIPGRNCELLDWFADTGGAITGALLMHFAYLNRLRRKKTG